MIVVVIVSGFAIQNLYSQTDSIGKSALGGENFADFLVKKKIREIFIGKSEERGKGLSITTLPFSLLKVGSVCHVYINAFFTCDAVLRRSNTGLYCAL